MLTPNNPEFYETLPPIPSERNRILQPTIQHKIYPNPPPEIQVINIRDPPPTTFPIGVPLHNNSDNPNSNNPYPGYQINYPYSTTNNIVIEDEENPKIQEKKPEKFMEANLNPIGNFEKNNENNGKKGNKKNYKYYSNENNSSMNERHYIPNVGGYNTGYGAESDLCYCCIGCRNPFYCMRRCRLSLNCCRCGEGCRSDCGDICKCLCCVFLCDSGCSNLIIGCLKLFCLICKCCVECLGAILSR